MMRTLIGITILLLVTIPSGAQQIASGVTCADVRKLTAVERWYWRKRLGLSDEQVRAIRKQCGLK